MCRLLRNVRQTSRQISTTAGSATILLSLMLWGLRHIQLRYQRLLRWDNHLKWPCTVHVIHHLKGFSILYLSSHPTQMPFGESLIWTLFSKRVDLSHTILDQTYRQIGRNGTTDWPARSSDLTLQEKFQNVRVEFQNRLLYC
jgi:hypothetical protein